MNIRNRRHTTHFIIWANPVTVSRYLGSAIHNTIIYEEVIRKAKQLDLLSEVSRTIVSDHHPERDTPIDCYNDCEGNGFTNLFHYASGCEANELFIAATQSLSQEYLSKPES